MPIRIKPVYDFGPCILDLERIKGICDLVDQNFSYALYSAEDGVWEVYDEKTDAFISAISDREVLDSLKIDARQLSQPTINTGAQIFSVTSNNEKTIEVIFDKHQATLKFRGPYQEEHWLEHFLIDFKKYLGPPSLLQRITERIEGGYVSSDYFWKVVLSSAGGISAIYQSLITEAILSRGVPYCHIILHKRLPNPFVESIKANLISSAIWIIIAFIGWFAFALLLYWIYTTSGINIPELFTPPTIPTSTPPP